MITIDRNKCTVCGCCIDVCSVFALSMVNDAIIVNEELCTKCENCTQTCAVAAISAE